MIRTDPNTIYLIAGKQNGKISNKTWILEFSDSTPNNLNIKEGPTLSTERSMHTCGKMIVNGKIRIVVAGGWNDTKYLDSVEILDPNALGEGWVSGTN